jgi:hypothetical protein
MICINVGQTLHFFLYIKYGLTCIHIPFAPIECGAPKYCNMLVEKA